MLYILYVLYTVLLSCQHSEILSSPFQVSAENAKILELLEEELDPEDVLDLCRAQWPDTTVTIDYVREERESSKETKMYVRRIHYSGHNGARLLLAKALALALCR